MKKALIILAAVLLCVLIVFGISTAPFMQSGPMTPGGTSAVSIQTAEPGGDNDSLPKTNQTVNLYRLSADTEEMVKPYTDAWNNLCAALQAQTGSFTFTSSEEKAVLLEAAAALPHASLFTVSGEGLEISIQYTDTYAEDTAMLQSVAESILRENVYADANDLEIAVILYTYLVTNASVNENCIAVYDVFNRYEGNAAAISRALCFLLSQFDIPCGIVSGDNGTCLAAVIRGQCLYFSPANEMKKENVRGLSCFGMNYEPAADLCGRFAQPSFAAGTGDTALGELFTGCTDWRLDAANHYLYLAYGSSEFTNAVATDDMAAAHG